MKANSNVAFPAAAGFAFILATDLLAAYKAWQVDLQKEFCRVFPQATTDSIDRRHEYWKQKWHHTELIQGPFSNGYVICNVTGER